MEYRWEYGLGKGYNGGPAECIVLYQDNVALGKFVFKRNQSNQMDTETLFAVVFVPAELEDFYEHLDSPEGLQPEDKTVLLEVKRKWDTFDIRNPGEIWHHTSRSWRKTGTRLKLLLGFGQ